MFFDGVFSDKEYAASKVVEIADKLLGRMSELVDGMENPDTQSIKQLSSALKDLRDIRTYGSELALRKAKLRKLEREAETEDGSDEIEVVFDAGLCAASATTLKSSGCETTTSIAFVPIDPVAPNMIIFLDI